jgi:hypothetical protein
MTESEAREAYRAAWTKWKRTKDPQKQLQYEQLMDELQPSIATSPSDPRWKAFTKTLPGFDGYMAQWWGNVLSRLGR